MFGNTQKSEESLEKKIKILKEKKGKDEKS